MMSVTCSSQIDSNNLFIQNVFDSRMWIVSNSNRMQDKCPHDNDHLPKYHWNKKQMTFILRNYLKKTGTGNSHSMQKKVKSRFQEVLHISQLPQHIFSLIFCNLPITVFYTTAGMFVSHGEILLYPDFAQLYLSIGEASSLILAGSWSFVKPFFKKMYSPWLMSFGHVLLL